MLPTKKKKVEYKFNPIFFFINPNIFIGEIIYYYSYYLVLGWGRGQAVVVCIYMGGSDRHGF